MIDFGKNLKKVLLYIRTRRLGREETKKEKKKKKGGKKTELNE